MEAAIFTKNEFHLMCDSMNGNPLVQYNEFFSDYYWRNLVKSNKQLYWRHGVVSDILDEYCIEDLVRKWEVDEIDFAFKLLKIQETNDFLELLEKVENFWKKTYPLGIRNN